MDCFVAIVVGIQLLLYLLLHSSAVAAATYADSFTPQETQSFWSSEGGQNYTFGFKNVGAGDYVLSIWHSRDANQTAIWWADFGENHTSTVKEGAVFNYSTSSAPILQLYDAASTLVWQCCGNSSGSSTSLRFLHTGNLRVLQENSTIVLWESFQDLRNSLMLVGVAVNALSDNPYLLQARKNQTSYARGRFHMATYKGTDRGRLFGLDARNNQYLYMDNISLNVTDGKLMGFYVNGAIHYASKHPELERVSLDYDGEMRVYRWFSSNSTWVDVWHLLVYTDAWLICRAQTPCGPFGICTVNVAGNVECSCPVGYERISADDPSKGCNSTRMPHGCGDASSNDTSIMVQQPGAIHFFYNDFESFSNISTIDSCKSLCLRECACVGATYLSLKCTLKANTTLGYLYNGLLTPTGTSIFLVKLLQLPESAPPTEKGRGRTSQTIAGVAASMGAVVLTVGVGFLIWWARRSGSNIVVLCSGKPHDDEALDAGLVRFHYHELVEATNNFSSLLGEGGYGKVYRGWLREKKGLQLSQGSAAGMAVAIKVLKQGAANKRGAEDSQEKKQFEAEMGTLSKIHHVNLVGLLGYCISGRKGEKRLLVYEYMPKGSLGRYLSPTHMKEPLPWSVRFSIAIGTARGIAYLHHDCKPRILHFDIKPENVLLDEKFTPKVADFGLAEHFYQRDQTHLSMPGMRGTPGYMAPEWLKSQRITSKVDVYSYGMVLLELVHGLNTTGNDHMSLIEWAFQCLAAGSILSDNGIEPATDLAQEADDMSLNEGVAMEGDDDLQQLHMLRVALWCLHHLPARRPSMSRVLQLIEGDDTIDNPPNPADATIPNDTLCMNGLSTSNSDCEVPYSVLSGR